MYRCYWVRGVILRTEGAEMMARPRQMNFGPLVNELSDARTMSETMFDY